MDIIKTRGVITSGTEPRMLARLQEIGVLVAEDISARKLAARLCLMLNETISNRES